MFCLWFFFFNDTATTEIYTRSIVGSVRCVQETDYSLFSLLYLSYSADSDYQCGLDCIYFSWYRCIWITLLSLLQRKDLNRFLFLHEILEIQNILPFLFV
eukprot:TRINITY_DN9629_c0_g1_i2.p1 TRINITY_DN9629_c0_g1~~TRINITY_DN9629_c0_g1_i2.p1  ORF type:complete len:100 (-),score=14.45 TRINITY_DN9629_c0_g1_i2:31-330(-)